MASAIVNVAFTRMTPIEFGTRWRTMIRHPPAPIIRAAWTNSRVRSVSTSPRTSRALVSQRDQQDREHAVPGSARVPA